MRRPRARLPSLPGRPRRPAARPTVLRLAADGDREDDCRGNREGDRGRRPGAVKTATGGATRRVAEAAAESNRESGGVDEGVVDRARPRRMTF